MYEVIKIGEKNYCVRFGMNALRIYTKKTNTPLNKLHLIGDEMLLDDAIVLAWCGLKDGHRKAGEEFNMNIDDVADLMDDDADALEKIMNVFADQFVAMYGGNEGESKVPQSPKKAKAK